MIELTSEKIGDAAAVRISGRIDTNTSPQLEDACGVWIARGERILILDFKNVHYISSFGLRTVLRVGKSMHGGGGQLITCSLSAMVREVFEIAGYDTLFRTYPSIEAALAADL